MVLRRTSPLASERVPLAPQAAGVVGVAVAVLLVAVGVVVVVAAARHRPLGVLNAAQAPAHNGHVTNAPLNTDVNSMVRTPSGAAAHMENRVQPGGVTVSVYQPQAHPPVRRVHLPTLQPAATLPPLATLPLATLPLATLPPLAVLNGSRRTWQSRTMSLEG